MRGAVRSPETVMGQSFDEDERDRKTVDTAAVEKQVSAVVRAENLIPTSLVDEEVSWFFNELGIEPSYFLDTPPKKLAEHVLAIFAAKVSAKARGEKQPNLLFRNVEDSRAVFFHTSNKGLRGSVLEIELDDTFLDSKTDHWTLESYRSIGKVSTEYQVSCLLFLLCLRLVRQDKLRCYFLRKTTLPCDSHYLSPKLLEEHRSMRAELASPTFHGSLLVRSDLSKHDSCRISVAYKVRNDVRVLLPFHFF
jgi:hypothetical protein